MGNQKPPCFVKRHTGDKRGEITGMKNGDRRVGIITFHCSNNFGAMLQAFALKTYLQQSGIKTDLVRYEPPFMTGRHWWFPYVPIEGRKKRLEWEKKAWKSHLRMGMDFFRQRANYNRFKRKYLIRRFQRKLLFSGQLKWLPYSCYVVGSDQIWNPDITYGLRKAYFGAFDNKRKKRVIAYAASLGGAALAEQHKQEFSGLVRRVDTISVREEEAISYVENCSQKKVISVLDPVFLLEKESWQQVEKVPDRKGYVLVYTAEWNKELQEYALALAKEKNLPAVILRASKWGEDVGFEADYISGPSEFLGYIHNADYVVTNSFHAIAFSIIYQKKFLAFLHSNRGARIRNILHIHELEGRLYNKEENTQIDAAVNWDRVIERTRESVKLTKDFLQENIP